MKNSIYCERSCLVFVTLIFMVIWNFTAKVHAQVYSTQYAVVIGINKYPHSHWQDLTYARNDAEGVDSLMQELGFTIYTLYDAQATRTKIVSLLEDELATRLQKNDAVFFFFAGHGTTRRKGGKVWGYVAPSDATDKDASLISVEELLTLSEKMGNAKHQLFIMDCCFGGLLGKERVDKIPESHAHYLREIGTRKARQILTAGGENQTVVDDGPGDHSVFTGYLIQGIRERQADVNGDGWITFSELTTYIGPAASRRGQTPGIRLLPGHELGEFLFYVPQPPVVSYPQPSNVTHRSGEEAATELIVPAKTPSTPRIYLRSTAATLSENQVKKMLLHRGFFDESSNKSGKGIKHLYRSVILQGQAIVIDDATALMWQQSGSSRYMIYAEAEQYIRDLKNQRYAGYSDWRLPTLEEAMSLMECEKKNGELYIDPVFDPKQRWIWTGDKVIPDPVLTFYKVASSVAWKIDFGLGFCWEMKLTGRSYVRAVRSAQ